MCWDDWQLKDLIKEFNIQFCKDCEDPTEAIQMTVGGVMGLGPEDFDYDTRKAVVDKFYEICVEARRNPIMTCYGRALT